MNTESKENFTPSPDSTLADALAAAERADSAGAEQVESTTEDEGKSTVSAPASVATEDECFAITQKAIEMLKTVYDPEIPVNVYDLGLIYKIDYTPEDGVLHVDMTLTAPGCPAADFILEDVRQKLLSVDGPKAVDLRLVFEPEWNQDMMSEEAKLELGFL